MPRKTTSKLENKEKLSTKTASTTKSKKIIDEEIVLPEKTTKTNTKASKKASSTGKKVSTKKTSSKIVNEKKSSTKKTNSAKTKKVLKVVDADEIDSTTNLTEKIEITEYYDLPYRYNQTVVKVLAQTPTTLFIYWDISDIDRANFVKQYGENFFNYTKPVLIIHNNSMHYSFEVDIDDFANSWYLHVNDSNCEYTVELGRRAKYYNEENHIDIPNNYLYVSSSNSIDAPNDHVLFDKHMKTIYFKDVKTDIVTKKDITSISFLRNMGKIYNLYDLHGDFNKDSCVDSNHWQLSLKNPSSSTSSLTFR